MNGVQPLDGVGSWLWRQGDGAGASGGNASAPAAWWINFGALTLPLDQSGNPTQSTTPTLTGFTGIGTLGGGNVTIQAGGTIGASVNVPSPSPGYSVSQGIDVAVASTGQVTLNADNTTTITQTGGGVLSIQAGGALNGGGTSVRNTQANGTLTDTRGSIDVLAASIGQIVLTYGRVNTGDPRAPSPFVAAEAVAQGGPSVVPAMRRCCCRPAATWCLAGSGTPRAWPNRT